MRIIFIFFFLCNVVIAENIFQNKPLFNTEVIPSGYAILDSASGDLNLDQYSDLILILKKIMKTHQMQKIREGVHF